MIEDIGKKINKREAEEKENERDRHSRGNQGRAMDVGSGHSV